MSNIGFIGTGTMGAPMAIHLVAAGHEVVAYNRSPERLAGVVQAGGTAADSMQSAVRDADVVALMVTDSSDVAAVLRDDGGVFDSVRPGTLIIDFSSISPDVSADLAAEAVARGMRMIDAPVSGGEAGAVNATLSIMVGGTAADAESAMPILRAVGKTIVHVGPNGSGQTVKAANQLVVAANIQVLAEAIVFLEACGVDTSAAINVLAGGLAGSAVLSEKAQMMLDRSFAPGFRIDLHLKDMGIATAAAEHAGVATPLGSAMMKLMTSARSSGDGRLDHSALIRGVERLSGRPLRPSTRQSPKPG